MEEEEITYDLKDKSYIMIKEEKRVKLRVRCIIGT